MNDEKTYWNGERTKCRLVLVRVQDRQADDPPLAWWRGLEGTQRRAVEVSYGRETFYLDDDEVPVEVHERNLAAIDADPKASKLFKALSAEDRDRMRGRRGDGWAKVTTGKGSPGWGHRSLPVAEVLGEVEAA
jgi:hypothetical protein